MVLVIEICTDCLELGDDLIHIFRGLQVEEIRTLPVLSSPPAVEEPTPTVQAPSEEDSDEEDSQDEDEEDDSTEESSSEEVKGPAVLSGVFCIAVRRRWCSCLKFPGHAGEFLV